ncbi:hypothetical protein DH2020_027730 [Rehmannia glutinosa]|uniref:GTD-binding domain-containing protein n=1 Tax=Rehmannia glutinosa TaxID=99300 RepID=A0ABR0VTD7_REHGL
MACEAVQMWSLSGLVAAFLDLSIAYLLLCGSAVAYLASTFLGFFGLNLPCPCDGMFLNIHGKIFCLNTLLLDFPTQKVSDVQLCVKQKFPFSDPTKHEYSIVGDNCVNGILEIEGEASCSSSVSDARRSVDLVRKDMSGKGGKYDMKGKGVVSNRPRSRLRNRKGVVLMGNIRVFRHVILVFKRNLIIILAPRGKMDLLMVIMRKLIILNLELRDNVHLVCQDPLSYNCLSTHPDNIAPTKMGARQVSITNVEMNHFPDADKQKKKLYIEELQDNPQGVQILSGDEKNAVRLLEQTLEEERIARAALYIELEKERSAAASAADEAMAMILRLQEEKASIEMEARQYQRILEEKSAYDAEELNILKEMLVRREMEKHFLEKEVEAYRQVFSEGNEQLAGDGSDQSDTFPIRCAEKIIVTCNGTETIDPYYDPSLKNEAKDAFLDISSSCDKMLDKDPHVYDVHIIGDGINSCSETNVDRNEHLSVCSSSKVREKNSVPFEAVANGVGFITDYQRNSSEITGGLPPIKPRGLSCLSEQRTSSLSTVDSEMLKIDVEVGRLRERLKLVQEGREKLSLSAEGRERGNIQLKLLEEIAHQVQEIWQITDPGKALRQMSLPLPTSKENKLRVMAPRIGAGRYYPRKGGVEVFLPDYREALKDDMLHEAVFVVYDV